MESHYEEKSCKNCGRYILNGNRWWSIACQGISCVTPNGSDTPLHWISLEEAKKRFPQPDYFLKENLMNIK